MKEETQDCLTVFCGMSIGCLFICPLMIPDYEFIDGLKAAAHFALFLITLLIVRRM